MQELVPQPPYPTLSLEQGTAAWVRFAATALHGILSNPELSSGELNYEAIAEDAARFADGVASQLTRRLPR